MNSLYLFLQVDKLLLKLQNDAKDLMASYSHPLIATVHKNYWWNWMVVEIVGLTLKVCFAHGYLIYMKNIGS